jgi:polyferredoxin
MKAKCTHRFLQVRTEKDRCSWATCMDCKKKGPKKHSYMLALICFATATINQHPRV